jgi:nitrite reductase/ring-hydroxylating ferredoxin subunit
VKKQMFGEIGVLASDGDRVQCHICGHFFHALNQHVMKKHKMACEDYRLAFGLNTGQPLASPEFSEIQRIGQTTRLAQYWSKDNANKMAAAAHPPRPLTPQGRKNMLAARRDPKWMALMRERRMDPDHPLNSTEVLAKNAASKATATYRAGARERVLNGTTPLLRPDVMAAARASMMRPDVRAKISAKNRGKKRTPLQRAAKAIQAKQQAQPQGKDGRFTSRLVCII